MASHGYEYQRKYETVAASQTAQALGATGKAGDAIEKLIITVATAATGTVTLIDGSGGGAVSIAITAANTPIGVYTVDLGGLRSVVGAWAVTTGAGATVLAVGRFS